MSEIISTFGIDWRLLIINSINFGLVLLALWYFLYAPLMRILEERRERVAQGVRDAQAAAEALEKAEADRAAKLAATGKEADALLAAARAAAAQKQRELAAAGERTAAQMVKEARLEAQELKQQSIAESRQEIAKLIVLGMEKIK